MNGTERRGCETFQDPVTGRAVRRLTCSDRHDKHAYYDVSTWSPDGQSIVFSSAAASRIAPMRIAPAGEHAGCADAEIWVMDADGGNPRRVADGAAFVMHVGAFPQWSRDGRRILFGGEYTSPRQLKMLDLDTGEVATLDDLFPRMVCPVGNSVACQSTRGVVVLDLDTLEQRLVVPVESLVRAVPGREPQDVRDTVVANIKWKPDGARLLLRFSGTWRGNPFKELYVFDADGSNLKRVAPASQRFHHHSWHPDGRTILFGDRECDDPKRLAIEPDGRAVSPGGGGVPYLFVADPEGQERQRVSDEPLGCHPSFSPDGTRIVTDNYGGRFGESLLLIDPKTGEVEKLVSTPTTSDHSHCGTQAHPQWGPDGKSVLYDSDQFGVCQVCVVEA